MAKHEDEADVPTPPHPLHRSQPLPWQSVKSSADDPQAALRVEELIRSGTYRRADRDPEFLDGDRVRGARLELDYLKPELHFRMRAKALVVFPGGFGTLDELFETLNLVQSRKIQPLPIVLVGKRFWRQAIDPDYLVNEGVIDAEDRELFWYAESAREIWEQICRWQARAGNPLGCNVDAG